VRGVPAGPRPAAEQSLRLHSQGTVTRVLHSAGEMMSGVEICLRL
jgi:hypothetical protein